MKLNIFCKTQKILPRSEFDLRSNNPCRSRHITVCGGSSVLPKPHYLLKLRHACLQRSFPAVGLCPCS